MRERSITQVLARAGDGDSSAAAALLPLVYEELRALAANCLKRERSGHTLQPTALVHEAYLRLVGSDQAWRGRTAFLAAAAVAMRRVLVDHARRRATGKRGSNAHRVALSDDLATTRRDIRVLEFDDLLTRLAEKDSRKSRVVELRFFAGMTHDQIAEALGVARSTVADDWTVARAWLASHFGDSEAMK